MISLAIVSVNLYVTVIQRHSAASIIDVSMAGSRADSVGLASLCLRQISIAIQDTHTQTVCCDTSGVRLILRCCNWKASKRVVSEWHIGFFCRHGRL